MGKRIALIIGVDEYKYDYFHNLEGAVRDMWFVHGCLKNSCKFDKNRGKHRGGTGAKAPRDKPPFMEGRKGASNKRRFKNFP